MRDIAKIIKANRGLEVTALDYGGWDHHINEGPADGELGRKLADVSGSLGAFVDDLGPELIQHVLVLVMSEFGRTVRENGNKGTDHGHGGFMLAVGGRLNGGNVYGKWTSLNENDLYERRDLPVHTDFRVAFAESLHGLFGFDGIKLGLFPEYTPESPPLGSCRWLSAAPLWAATIAADRNAGVTNARTHPTIVSHSFVRCRALSPVHCATTDYPTRELACFPQNSLQARFLPL
jgi:hypothetical protein